VTVTIDLDKIGQRIVALPLPARDYQGLVTGKAGNVLFARKRSGNRNGKVRRRSAAQFIVFDMDKRRAEKILDGVTQFEVAGERRENAVRASAGTFHHRFDRDAAQTGRRRFERRGNGSLR
jgi:tricorn protease-like protein